MFVTSDHHKRGKRPDDYRDRKLIFLDLEMTGSDPEIHEIIEAGWLVVEGRSFSVLSEYEAKIRPQHIETADPEGLSVAEYSEKDWKKAKELKSVLLKLSKIAPYGMLVGSAVYHDWEFLERAFTKFSLMPKFSFRLLPLESMAYLKLYNDLKAKSISMRSVAAHLGVEYSETHGALEDARLSYRVFKALMGVK